MSATVTAIRADAPPDVDLKAALEASYRAEPDDAKVVPPFVMTARESDDNLHLGGDVAGMCDRLTWARRSGEKIDKPEPSVLLGWSLGHIGEHVMLHRIGHGLDVLESPYYLSRPTTPVEYRGCVGHVDALLCERGTERVVAVVDTKTTVWWSKNEGGSKVWYPPDAEPKMSQQVQVASYATALNLSWAVLFELDLASKGCREFWVDAEAMRGLVDERVSEVIDLTDPSKAEPEVGPLPRTEVGGGKSWMCGYTKRAKDGTETISKYYCQRTTCVNHVMSAEVSF